MCKESGRPVRVSYLWSSELLVDYLLIALGLVFLIESRNVGRGFQQALDARVYPRVVAALVVIVLCMHVAQTIGRQLRASRVPDGSMAAARFGPSIPPAVRTRVFAVFALFVAYILVIRRVGYFETGFLFLVGSMIALGDRSARWIMRSLLVALIITIAIYIVFGVILNIYVPRGILLR